MNDVQVDGTLRQATCAVDPGKFDADEAIEALANAGYANSAVREP